jgi:carbon-monoxide dehydrogenase large subunit
VPFGDEAATARAFGDAALVVEREFVINRVVNCQMEPRATIGTYDPATGVYTLIAGSQGAVRQRVYLASALNVPIDKVQVICPDVGGGFGPRTYLYSEAVLVAWASRRVSRPVRWTSDRSEAFLTDFGGRDVVTRAALAFDKDGRILALRSKLFGNVGAHTASYVPLSNGYRVISTVYDVKLHFVTLHGVLTNTVPTAPYRGAGRPEATFVMERLLDIAARRLKLDRLEIRRRNLVPKHALPYRNVTGLTYDSGDFHGNMDLALARADWAGFPARQAESRRNGHRRGIGIANYVESPVGAPREKVIITVRPDDTVEVIAGTQSTGQGHETTFAQVIADQLGVKLDSIKLVTGDTRMVLVGGGTHSDRSMRLGGTLLVQASEKIVARARDQAALLLDAKADNVEFTDGLFRAPGSNRALSLFDLARAQGPLTESAEFNGRMPAFPTGCAVCELEVDPDTGTVRILRYTSVDDVGQAINPLIVDGQVHGGIVQGVGQALTETVVHDDNGQVLSGSFMDYGLPRADQFPGFDVELTEDPTGGNPLRVKGGGESGITPSLAAVINALVDALGDYGIEHIEMPATPLRVWAAIQQATKTKS